MRQDSPRRANIAPRRSLCRWLWLGNVTQYADSEALVPDGRVQCIGPDTECVFGSGRRVSYHDIVFWAARRSGQADRLRGR